MKKTSKLLFLAILPSLFLGAFSSKNDCKTSIVCTMYPEYEWVKEVTKGNDNINIKCLIGNDVHSYQPSVSDIASINKSDLFIYVGGESDEWVDDALKSATKKVNTINLLDALGDNKKIEEEKEGMEGHEHDHEDGDDHDHDHDHEEEEEEYDEHVWNSLKNAKIFVNAIKDKMVALDEANKELYETNTTTYVGQIDALYNEYKAKINAGTHKTLVVADRFPFRYLFDEYGLDYYAAFSGCSTDSDASFKTVVFLANKIDELGLDNILVTTNSDGKIGESVKQNTTNKNQKLLKLDSMEAYKKEDFLSVFKKNLDVLVEASK